MKTLWVVDDEVDLLEIYIEVFSEEKKLDDIKKKYVTHFDGCKPVAGDIVIHDLCGVSKLNRADGVTYFSCSGSFTVKSDFSKPMDFDHMIETISELL